MEYSNLVDLIKSITLGTSLQIGVVFFGGYGNEKFVLPKENRIHTSRVCEYIKSQPSRYRRCYKCKNIALQKAIQTKQGFGGECIYGIYEYTHPIVEQGNVVAIVFVGNILPENTQRLQKNLDDVELMNTLEKSCSLDKCKSIALVIESYIRLVSTVCKNQQKTYNPLIENFKGFIEDNLEYNVGAEELAQMFHYNKKYLGRLFKKQTSEFLTEYGNKRRVERAKELLSSGNLSVKQAALKVGIDNVPYFNRLFKKLTGQTPSEFRKNK
ncbi:MAG: helix-turn-helix domain-containing protein [Clostridia bacterium]|nr:helix-turn-helix domain-containing protein [Clostridia bacterium]